MRRNKLTDEQLAALIDKQQTINLESLLLSEVSLDDFEVMSATKKALTMEHKPSRFKFPDWRQIAAAPQMARPMYSNLAMAGFLGDESSEEDDENESEDSPQTKK